MAAGPVRFVSLLLAVLVLGVAFGCGSACAQYPSKPVRMIEPFPLGGSSDVFARIIGQKLSERLKQPVVIDNRPGAGGTLGSDVAAKSPPDGYTLIDLAPEKRTP